VNLTPQVAQVVERLRPHLQRDGGDVVLAGVDEATGVVAVELSGSCAGCSSSEQATTTGIERIVRDHVPEVVAVVAVHGEPVEDGTPVSL
jgi:Fe-S cluster biogenesis protein NfuA